MGVFTWSGSIINSITVIEARANFLYKDISGNTPLDVAMTDEIKQFIMNHPWYRRRSLLVTRPMLIMILIKNIN